MSQPAADLGREGERLAARFLRKRGCRILQRNYTCPCGEMDLVVLDGDEIVFVEIRTRTDEAFGHPAESVTPRKQRQIGRVASHYAARHRLTDRPMRFDVMAVTAVQSGRPQIEHFPDAFPLDPAFPG